MRRRHPSTSLHVPESISPRLRPRTESNDTLLGAERCEAQCHPVKRGHVELIARRGASVRVCGLAHRRRDRLPRVPIQPTGTEFLSDHGNLAVALFTEREDAPAGRAIGSRRACGSPRSAACSPAGVGPGGSSRGSGARPRSCCRSPTGFWLMSTNVDESAHCLPAVPSGARPPRMINTERRAWMTTFRATLPRTRRSTPPSPREPVTMRSEPCSSAAARISWAGSPLLTWAWPVKREQDLHAEPPSFWPRRHRSSQACSRARASGTSGSSSKERRRSSVVTTPIGVPSSPITTRRWICLVII